MKLLLFTVLNILLGSFFAASVYEVFLIRCCDKNFVLYYILPDPQLIILSAIGSFFLIIVSLTRAWSKDKQI